MALDSPAVKFLLAAKSRGVDFTSTAMIGRQSFRPDPLTLRRAFSILRIAEDPDRFLAAHAYSEPFFALLGAKEVASVDVSTYEGATHVHDMNNPIPDELRARFDVVYDGGTLEHVFHIIQALKNCMEMVKVGGHFVQVNIANNYMGHGFWQFSPELIYRIFCQANGYSTEAVLLHEVVPGGAWYLASDPERLGRRVELCNRRRTYILTVARRVAERPIFESPPQQSDYVAAWNGATGPRSGSAGLRRFVPRPLMTVAKGILRPFREFDRRCYRRVGEKELLSGTFG